MKRVSIGLVLCIIALISVILSQGECLDGLYKNLNVEKDREILRQLDKDYSYVGRSSS